MLGHAAISEVPISATPESGATYAPNSVSLTTGGTNASFAQNHVYSCHAAVCDTTTPMASFEESWQPYNVSINTVVGESGFVPEAMFSPDEATFALGAGGTGFTQNHFFVAGYVGIPLIAPQVGFGDIPELPGDPLIPPEIPSTRQVDWWSVEAADTSKETWSGVPVARTTTKAWSSLPKR